MQVLIIVLFFTLLEEDSAVLLISGCTGVACHHAFCSPVHGLCECQGSTLCRTVKGKANNATVIQMSLRGPCMKAICLGSDNQERGQEFADITLV